MSLLKALMPAIAALSSPAQATPPAINDPMLKFEQQQMFQPQVPPDVNAPPKYPSLLAPKQMNLTDQLKPLQQIQQEAADKYIAEKEALTQDRSEEVRTILEQTQATKNRVPYKYLVLHKPGLNNKDETVAFMQKKGVGYNEAMPPHGYLKDTEIAQILTYVRSSFGNNSSAITANEVSRYRAGRR